MNRYFYTSVLALALVTAYAVSQTGSYPSSSQPSNQPQSGQTNTPDASQSTSPSTNNPSAKDQSKTGQSMPQSDQTMATVDDQTLHTKVHEQLSTNPALSNVNVTVNNGVVTLDGSVATKQDRKEAKKIAESVPGVKKVKDKLKVEARQHRAQRGGQHRGQRAVGDHFEHGSAKRLFFGRNHFTGARHG
jgi:osmotically-inducible protein OsmY